MEEKRHAPLFLLLFPFLFTYLQSLRESLFNLPMDSIVFNNVKAEKAKALRRFNRFRTIGRFLRAAEFFFALLFICWTFTRLPFAFQISGAFLRRIAAVISTPLFVFLLGNSIVVVLLTKSSDQKAAGVSSSAETEIYEAFVRSVENRCKPSDEDLTNEIVYEDKQVIVSDPNSNQIVDGNIPHIDSSVTDTVNGQAKVYGRSKSDASGKQMVIKRSLQRSETENMKWKEKAKAKEELDDKKNKYPEDKLSNEEFQKTIEAFIAKQLMFRRQESLPLILHP